MEVEGQEFCGYFSPTPLEHHYQSWTPLQLIEIPYLHPGRGPSLLGFLALLLPPPLLGLILASLPQALFPPLERYPPLVQDVRAAGLVGSAVVHHICLPMPLLVRQ